MKSYPSTGLWTTFLVVGLCLVVALTLGLVPLATCPRCHGTGESYASGKREYVWLCGSCKGGKISLLKLWSYRRQVPDSLEWEGMPVSAITVHGCTKTTKARAMALTRIQPGDALSQKRITAARSYLGESKDYAEVDIQVQENPKSPGTLTVDIFVTER